MFGKDLGATVYSSEPRLEAAEKAGRHPNQAALVEARVKGLRSAFGVGRGAALGAA
ncbi:MAG: hypothetical protein WDN72_11465 [Alphaproteobacteria bacterium]